MIRAALDAGDDAGPAVRVVRAWAQWLIDDPGRAATDQNSELLGRVLGSGGGDDTMHGLLELLEIQ